MQSIEDMPDKPNAICFDQDDVTYQGWTARGFPAIYIFDDDTKVIGVYNKQTGNFFTSCQLKEHQETELKTTHNFGGVDDCYIGKVNNLPPEGIIPRNNFENDIMDITQVENLQIDNFNN
jgi:hypothetical protein